jgi:hypothetical protein
MTVKVLTSDALDRHQTTPIKVFLNITAAGVFAVAGNNKCRATFGSAAAGALTDPLGQTTIDQTLGSVNEVLAATAFGATAMGVDAIGGVIDCEGQIRDILDVKVRSNIGSGGAQVSVFGSGQTTALPNTLPALVRVQKTSLGNIAIQAVLAGLDAASSGFIELDFEVELT